MVNGLLDVSMQTLRSQSVRKLRINSNAKISNVLGEAHMHKLTYAF